MNINAIQNFWISPRFSNPHIFTSSSSQSHLHLPIQSHMIRQSLNYPQISSDIIMYLNDAVSCLRRTEAGRKHNTKIFFITVLNEYISLCHYSAHNSSRRNFVNWIALNWVHEWVSNKQSEVSRFGRWERQRYVISNCTFRK